MHADPSSRPTAAKRRMRNVLVAVMLGTTMLAGTAAVAVPPPALAAPAPTNATQALPDSFAPLVRRVSPAVVTISATHEAARAERAGARLPQVPPNSPLGELLRRFGIPFDEGDGPDAGARMSLGSGFVMIRPATW
jgi:serine protease Do